MDNVAPYNRSDCFDCISNQRFKESTYNEGRNHQFYFWTASIIFDIVFIRGDG